jgi:hypothetical protein
MSNGCALYPPPWVIYTTIAATIIMLLLQFIAAITQILYLRAIFGSQSSLSSKLLPRDHDLDIKHLDKISKNTAKMADHIESLTICRKELTNVVGNLSSGRS